MIAYTGFTRSPDIPTDLQPYLYTKVGATGNGDAMTGWALGDLNFDGEIVGGSVRDEAIAVAPVEDQIVSVGFTHSNDYPAMTGTGGSLSAGKATIRVFSPPNKPVGWN